MGKLFLILFLIVSFLTNAQYGLDWKLLPNFENSPAIKTELGIRYSKIFPKEPVQKIKEEYTSNTFNFYKKTKEEVIDLNYVFDSVDLVSTRNIQEQSSMYFKDISTSNIKYLDKSHGFFTNSVSSVVEDENGLIYLGGDEGLGVYNGTEFLVYDKCGKISLKGIEFMYKDSFDRIWISTPSASIYIKSGKMFFPKNEFINGRNTVFKEVDGKVYFYTIGNGILKLEGSKLTQTIDNFISDKISVAFLDSKQRMWLSFENDNYGYIRNDSIFLNSQPKKHFVHSVFEDEETIWFGTFYGELYKYRNDSIFDITNSVSKFGKMAFYDFKKAYGEIWITKYGYGLVNINRDGVVRYVGIEEGLCDRHSYKMHIDSYGNIWVADLYKGISRLDADILYKGNEKYSPESISSISWGKNDEKWYIPNGGFLHQESEDKYITYLNDITDELPSSQHMNGSVQIGEKIIAGSYSLGLMFFDTEKYESYRFTIDDNYYNSLFDIQLDSKNRIWGKTLHNKLLYFENDTFYNCSQNSDWENFTFSRIFKLKDGKVAALTESNGLIIIDGDRFTHLDSNNEFSDFINAVFEDERNNIWVFINGEIVISDKNGRKTIIKNESLDNNPVQQVIEFEKDKFLCRSNNGLLLIQNKKDFSVRLFDESYGLNFIGINDIFHLEKEKFLVTTRGSIFKLDLNRLLENKAPKLSLASAFCDSNQVSFPDVIDQHSILKLNFNNILWGGKPNLMYRISKDGFKENWLKNNSSSLLQLSEFSYGEFQIEVKSLNGEYESETLNFSFVVKPYWYQTIIFRVLIVVFVLLILWLYIKNKASIAKKAQKILEIQVDEKTQELKLEKEELAKQLDENKILLKEVHHRVKNNMQMVSSLLELQLDYVEDKNAEKVIKEGNDRIKALAFAHQNLYLNDDFSNIKLKGYIELIVKNLLSNTNVKCEISIPENEVINIEKTQAIGFTVNELITNSIKYGFINTGNINNKIKINLIQLEGNYILEYCDNGVGFPKNLNFMTNETLGAVLIRSFVLRKLKGEIDISNDNGAVTIITFPI